MKIPRDVMEGLVKARVVTLRGRSGKPATVEQAAQAPMLCQMHSHAGRTYDLAVEGGAFIATERRAQ